MCFQVAFDGANQPADQHFRGNHQLHRLLRVPVGNQPQHGNAPPVPNAQSATNAPPHDNLPRLIFCVKLLNILFLNLLNLLFNFIFIFNLYLKLRIKETFE